MNSNCELILGPCTCGAWHTQDEFVEFAHELQREIGYLQRELFEERQKLDDVYKQYKHLANSFYNDPKAPSLL